MSALWLPVLLIVGLIVIIVVWAATGPIIAFVAFALLASGFVGLLDRRRRSVRMRTDD